jgi:hypothetical protein
MNDKRAAAMDTRRLWNWAVAGSSAWVLFGAMGASAKTLDGDLTYARPDRGETVHRVPANSPGDAAGGAVVNTSWSAPSSGTGLSLPGNASVHHPGSGFGRLLEAVSGDRSYTLAASSFGAVSIPEASAPARRARSSTPPRADAPEHDVENDENSEETPNTPSASGDQPAPRSDAPASRSDAPAIVAANLSPPADEEPLPFVDDQPPPNPEPEQALGPGGEQEAARQPLIAQVEIAAVPEPFSLGLLGAGLLGLGWLRRRPKV